ncbi:MAG TPA: S-methyl-5'-thioadenosine phosphorylase [Ktedonobacterales bacterium]|jgi:5'-methylthioadenosine phosphorylase
MAELPQATIGVIGGSGLYQMDGLSDVEEVRVETPFGAPSDAITVGRLGDISLAFLPRHGRGHRLNPTEVPSRANIWALKQLGVQWVFSVSAVGSLREDYAPLHLVVPDQIFDRTRLRPGSFFEGGVVIHASFADPFCPHLSGLLWETMSGMDDVTSHRGGTLVCIEGPLFSTKAESHIYRQLGCDIIGMTALPEAKLAREAELCYATIACVTDYDVWRESEETVTVEMVVANLQKNVSNAQRIIRELAGRLPADRSASPCGCSSALANAILTNPSDIPARARERYALLLDKYLPNQG